MHQLIVIDWVDSKGCSSSWDFIDDMQPMLPVQIRTVGFIERNNKKYITVFQSYSNDQVVGRMTIPKCCVLKITKLKSPPNKLRNANTCA